MPDREILWLDVCSEVPFSSMEFIPNKGESCVHLGTSLSEDNRTYFRVSNHRIGLNIHPIEINGT